MGPLERRELSPQTEPKKPAELIRLEENLPIFWTAAHVGYEQAGRELLLSKLTYAMIFYLSGAANEFR
jgi:hypothetical protein